MKGGCLFGSLRYDVTTEADLKAKCHCRECQYMSVGGTDIATFRKDRQPFRVVAEGKPGFHDLLPGR